MKYFLTLVLLGLCNPAFSLGVRSGQVTTSKIAAGSVTTPKLHSDALLNFPGRIGVGIAAPVSLIQAQGSIYANATANNTVFDAAAIGVQDASLILGGGRFALRVDTTHGLHFDTFNGGAELAAMTILEGGNVGVGEAAPATELHIDGAATSVSTMTIGNSVNGGGNIQLFANAGKGGATIYLGASEVNGARISNESATLDITPRSGFDMNILMGGEGVIYVTPKASAPSTCIIGETYIDTSGAYCACGATNTWEKMNATGACS